MGLTDVACSAIACSHQKTVVRLEMLYAKTCPPDPDKDNFIAQLLTNISHKRQSENKEK